MKIKEILSKLKECEVGLTPKKLYIEEVVILRELIEEIDLISSIYPDE